MPKQRINRNAGFTLIEMLVVIGIIAALLSFALVGLNAARKAAAKTRVKDDFQMITMALTQYRSDFQDYPRFADPLADKNDSSATSGNWLDTQCTDRGARLLCQALIAPGPAVSSSTATLGGADGADGPGFRARRSSNGTTGGKIYGPYLAPDKFKMEFNPATPNMQDAKILDNMGNVILYYPALPGPPAVQVAYVQTADPKQYRVGSVKPLYNAYDNTYDSTTFKALLNQTEMQYLLGDTTGSGYISTGQAATTTAPYLLWTAGPDGLYGRSPASNNKSDDIANFDFAPSVTK